MKHPQNRARDPPLPGRNPGGRIPGLARNHAAVDILNGLLLRERSAVATYVEVARALSGDHRDELDDNRESHARRAALIVGRILDLGGIPVATGQAWRACVRAIRSAAAMAGPAVPLRCLEDGERRALAAYVDLHAIIDPVSAVLIQDVLMPEQVRSHARLARMLRVPPG
jgi:hypothetical protein